MGLRLVSESMVGELAETLIYVTLKCFCIGDDVWIAYGTCNFRHQEMPLSGIQFDVEFPSIACTSNISHCALCIM